MIAIGPRTFQLITTPFSDCTGCAFEHDLKACLNTSATCYGGHYIYVEVRNVDKERLQSCVEQALGE